MDGYIDTTDYSGINGLIDMASSQYKLSALSGGASAFAKIASAGMNYQALQTNAAALKVQANSIELQARQRANMLREQFIGAIGSYQFSAANRGVSVGSGSVRDNIESSAISLGKDIQSAKQVAQMQANALRTQAKVAKLQAKSELVGGILGSVGTVANAVSSWGIGSSLANSIERTYTKDLNASPKTAPVPGLRPF